MIINQTNTHTYILLILFLINLFFAVIIFVLYPHVFRRRRRRPFLYFIIRSFNFSSYSFSSSVLFVIHQNLLNKLFVQESNINYSKLCISFEPVSRSTSSTSKEVWFVHPNQIREEDRYGKESN